MNVRSTFYAAAFCAGIGALLCPPPAVAANTGSCNDSPAQRASWINFLALRLHNHDPENASTMREVASQIIDGQTMAIKQDLQSGLDPNKPLKLGENSLGDMSLLSLAASACQNLIAEALVDAGASVDGAGSNSPPLVIASGNGDVSLTRYLISKGARVDRVDVMNHSALEDAVREHQLDVVDLLLKSGANPNLGVGGNATVLDIAASSSTVTDKAIANDLRAHGAHAKRDEGN